VALTATIGNFLQGWDNATIAGMITFSLDMPVISNSGFFVDSLDFWVLILWSEGIWIRCS